MSSSNPKELSPALARFQKSLDEDKEYDKKVEDFKHKKLLVDDYKYTNELVEITKNESDLEKVNNVNVLQMSDEETQTMMDTNSAYLEGAKNGMLFLNKSFEGVVPCWPGNIILIGARTGGGKSSATANLIYSTIQQINPTTGETRKILCISNEETNISVYNRLTCLIKGWNINNVASFTDEQKSALVESCGKWSKKGVMVIGNDNNGLTETIEGIASILNNLLKAETKYDMILIDYIQKVNKSKKNTRARPFDVIKEVMNLIDRFKNVYPAPIVITSQLSSQNLGDPENEKDFQDRLRGDHDLITPCTVALEMVPYTKKLQTDWIVRKNRYNGRAIDTTVETAFDNGKFVPMTDEWKAKVNEMIQKKSWNEGVGKLVKEKIDENAQ